MLRQGTGFKLIYLANSAFSCPTISPPPESVISPIFCTFLGHQHLAHDLFHVARQDDVLYAAVEQPYAQRFRFAGAGTFHRAIMRKIPLLIDYQSFKASVPAQGVYYPYLLKEYRNRWFLIAKPGKGKALVTLALDRMIEVQEMAAGGFVEYDGVDFERYYADTIGVTRSERDRGRKIVLWVHPKHAPYVLTKPLHASQELLKQDETGVIICICVVLNFELERELLGFGEFLKVLSPRDLQRRIAKRINQLKGLYEDLHNVTQAVGK